MPQLKPTRGIRLNKSHLLARDLVGLWLFNEGTGRIVFDSSRHGNNGIFVGDTHFIPGKFGNALDLDGTGDYVNVGNGASLNWGASDFSVAFWGKTDTTLGGFIVGKDDTAPYWFVQMLSDGDSYFLVGDGVNTAVRDFNVPWSDNKWHFLVFTVDHSSSTGLKCYVDGIVSSRTDDPSLVGSLDNARGLGFGTRDVSDPGTYWMGQLDHVLIYTRSLSVFEIALLYQKPFCMFEEAASPKVVITVPAAAARHAVGFRPIEGAERLGGLRRNALY